jgi:hypothetical protein
MFGSSLQPTFQGANRHLRTIAGEDRLEGQGMNHGWALAHPVKFSQ